VFTTLTVNKTFRTAAHRDAGDLDSGLSNLLVLSNNGNYSGGYLVFPQVRIAVNVRPGDLLLVNNHEVIHGNTPIVLEDDEAERISIVCYFREKMLELGTHEYEDARFRYVESRRLNKEHPMWKKLWNGVSPGMWDEKEWYDYLRSQPNGDAMVAKYHSDANNADLDEFFA
jgi:isocitrate dehydrogenase kinase/phosphatase